MSSRFPQQTNLGIVVVFLALKNPETPLAAKAVAVIAIGYALSPIDLIPDFIPVLGYLDDLIILPVLVALAIKLIPQEVLEQCQKEAENLWQDGKPKKWYYAIPILLIWVVVVFFIVKRFL